VAFGRELQQALEESATGFAVADRAGRIVLANPTWSHVHGCSDAAHGAVGRLLVDFIADRRAGEALLERARRHGAAVSELDHVRSDGERFATWMALTSIHLPGEPPSWSGFTVLLRDATAQRQAERALRDTEERLRMLSEFLCEYAYSLRLAPDGTPRVEWLSERFWEMSGIPRGALTREQVEALIPLEDMPRVREWIAGVLSGTVHLFGNTLLAFDSGQITSIAGSSEVRILGPDAFLASGANTTSNSALTTLASNAGNFYLEEGATLTTTVGLTNSNDLRLDLFFGQGGSSLTVGGTLTNTDLITIGNTGLDAGQVFDRSVRPDDL